MIRQLGLSQAENRFVAVLGGYIESRRDIPQPSPGREHPLVALPALVAAKIALYRAMRKRGLGLHEIIEWHG